MVSARKRQIAFFALFTLLLLSLIRTAWLSDDAYISFRTADNILNGHGPVWNVGERVQAFTHPLWLALCTAAFAITGNVYYTAIAVSVVITMIFATWLALGLATSSRNMVLCGVAMLSSKAFIDFSTSGLENPLTHLLLLAFIWQWQRGHDTHEQLGRLALIVSLCALNRMDLALLLGPALAYAAWRQGVAGIRPLVIGLIPFLAWELFATFYYGTPLPNTAYAKLSDGMTAEVRLQRGIDYLLRTLLSDPATLPVIVLGLFTASKEKRTSDWPLVLGVILYIAYVVRVGGDFMMGRFLTGPFVVALALLARAEWTSVRKMGTMAPSAMLVLGLLAPWEPALVSGFGYSYANNWLRGRATREPADQGRYVFLWQIMDERRNYYEFAGLLKVGLRGEPEHAWTHDGRDLRARGRQVVIRDFIGLVGFYAGPAVHIIDSHALSDPLLARLPGGDANSVIGHLLRRVPEGYLETIEQGTNRLADANLAAYHAALRQVVSGPLWSGERLRTLATFLLGGYDHHLRAFLIDPAKPAPG